MLTLHTSVPASSRCNRNLFHHVRLKHQWTSSLARLGASDVSPTGRVFVVNITQMLPCFACNLAETNNPMQRCRCGLSFPVLLADVAVVVCVVVIVVFAICLVVIAVSSGLKTADILTVYLDWRAYRGVGFAVAPSHPNSLIQTHQLNRRKPIPQRYVRDMGGLKRSEKGWHVSNQPRFGCGTSSEVEREKTLSRDLD